MVTLVSPTNETAQLSVVEVDCGSHTIRDLRIELDDVDSVHSEADSGERRSSTRADRTRLGGAALLHSKWRRGERHEPRPASGSR